MGLQDAIDDYYLNMVKEDIETPYMVEGTGDIFYCMKRDDFVVSYGINAWLILLETPGYELVGKL